MAYESFQNSKNKINKNWNRIEDNKNKLENIPIVSLDFRSINFNKNIVTVLLLTDQLMPGLPSPKTVLLKKFPEWALNMVEPHVIYTIEDGFVDSIINTTFQEANDNGTLKTGDVFIDSDFQYWFNHIDKVDFLLKIFYRGSAVSANVTEHGFSATTVPVRANMFLKVYNQRIYETMNEKFE